MSDWVAILIAALALLFSVASWWWLYAHRGHIRGFAPHSFAYTGDETVMRIRLPLILENTGAIPIIVQNFQLHFPEEPDGLLPIPWALSRGTIRPGTGDGEALPAVFAVAGRSAQQHFIEFAAPFPGIHLTPRAYTAQLDVKLGHKDSWTRLVSFPLLADRITAPDQFIAYSNAPVNPSPVEIAKTDRALEGLLNQLKSKAPEDRG